MSSSNLQSYTDQSYALSKCAFLAHDLTISKPIFFLTKPELGLSLSQFNLVENYNVLKNCVQEGFADKYNNKLEECYNHLISEELSVYRECLQKLHGEIKSDIDHQSDVSF